MNTTPAPSNRPLLLSELLGQSLTLFQKNLLPILIASVVFGSALFAVNVLFGAHVGIQATDVMNQQGIDMQRVMDLSERAQQGDTAAQEELTGLANELNIGSEEEAQQRAMETGIALLKNVAPAVGGLMLVTFLLTLAATAYYILLALRGTSALSDLPSVLLPFIGLQLWIVLRTFVWIPVIGLITGIILGPRFLPASVIMLQEKKGVFESARESYRRTEGYWGKIIGNVIVAGLCSLLVTIVANIVIVFIATTSDPLVGYWLKNLVQSLLMGFMAGFGVLLSLTVLAHPRSASTPQ